MGIQSPKTKVLLFVYFASFKSNFIYTPCLSHAKFLKFSLYKLKNILMQLEKDGSLKNISGVYKVTQLGFELLFCEVGGLRPFLKTWDSNFTIFVYKPSKEIKWLKDVLRRALTKWGFANWNKAFWISTYDFGNKLSEIKKLCDKSEVKTFYFYTKEFFGELNDFSSIIWSSKSYENEYLKIVKDIELNNNHDKKIPLLRELYAKYITALKSDFGLPEALNRRFYNNKVCFNYFITVLAKLINLNN